MQSFFEIFVAWQEILFLSEVKSEVILLEY